MQKQVKIALVTMTVAMVLSSAFFYRDANLQVLSLKKIDATRETVTTILHQTPGPVSSSSNASSTGGSVTPHNSTSPVNATASNVASFSAEQSNIASSGALKSNPASSSVVSSSSASFSAASSSSASFSAASSSAATSIVAPKAPLLEDLLTQLTSKLSQIKNDRHSLSQSDSIKLRQLELLIPQLSIESLPVETAPVSQQAVVAGDVTNVLLLSYQRTGSSFIGNLFHYTRNPDVFYIYEPLDLVYTSMYGTDMGWNIPTDIRVFSDGSARSLPEQELATMTMTIQSIFSCTMSKLPISMLIHRFWNQFSAQMYSAPYVRCLTANRIQLTKTLDACRVYIKKTCGGRFNGAAPNLNLCQRALYNNGTWYSTYDELLAITTPQNADGFRKYFQCISRYEQQARTCAVQHFDNVCKTKHIRAVKTVRAPMTLAQRLFEKVDQFKVVHSYRDPRGAVRSRSVNSWAQGRYDGPVLSKLAKTYCEAVTEDYRLWGQLKEDHPGDVNYMIYDDYVNRPVEVARDLMNFCNIHETAALKLWLVSVTRPKDPRGKSSTARAAKWEGLFKPNQVADINSKCHDFYEITPFEWQRV